MAAVFLVVVVLLAIAISAADGPARTLKGDGPTTIAAGFGSVWVGTGNGEIVRLDAGTGRVQRRHVQARWPAYVSDLVAAYGFLWLGDSSRSVARLDPVTGRIHELPAVAARTPGPGPVAAGAGSVWSGDWEKRHVFRIAPRTGRVAASARLPGNVMDLAAGPAGAYAVYAPRGIAGPRVLSRVGRQTARRQGRGARFRCDLGVAVGASDVWTADYCTWRLARRDPLTLGIRAQRPVPQLATRVLLAHGSVWLLGGSRLLRIDPRTLRTRAHLWVRAADAAATRDALWLLDMGDGNVGVVRRLDVATNRLVGRPIRIGP